MAELTRARAHAILAAHKVIDGSDPEALETFMVDATQLGLGEEGFEWMRWPAYRQRQVEQPAFIAVADLETLRRVTTTHVRLERFVSGHLLRMQEVGVPTAIVDRLRALLEANAI